MIYHLLCSRVCHFDQSPNIFISSTRLCDGMNEFGDSIPCGMLFHAFTYIRPELRTRNNIQRNLIPKWNACNGRDECINCHHSAWLDSPIIYSGLNWWIVCRRQIILDRYHKHLALLLMSFIPFTHNSCSRRNHHVRRTQVTWILNARASIVACVYTAATALVFAF